MRSSAGFRALLAALLSALLLNGCAQLPRASVVGEQEQVRIPERPPGLGNGSIYQARHGFQPLFEDRRPRTVGDILTIVLNEQVSASKNAASTADRAGSASLTPALVPDTRNLRLKRLGEVGFDIEGDSAFSGGGGSRANNAFSGTITGQNTVPSTQVADARIEYVGDGYINEAQHMGWLQRIFLNISPF